MSLIASFWTLGAEQQPHIVAAFKPVDVVRRERRWLIFRTTKTETTYTWFDYIQEAAHEEPRFEHSGIAMADFDLILSQTRESVFGLGLPDSNALSEYCQASAALFDPERAGTALAHLESFDLSEADVVAYYDSESKPTGWRCEPSSVVAAHRHLAFWFRTVVPGRIGLLMIG